MINTNDMNIPSLFVKKSVHNTDIIANTKNDNIPPISSQINVFHTICHPPGFCGSLIRDIRRQGKDKYYDAACAQESVLSIVVRDGSVSCLLVFADVMITSSLFCIKYCAK
jgi:hypothetical protein